MTTLSISRNVAIVPIERVRKRRKYPFEDLSAGDMFFVPGERRIASYVSAIGSRINRSFKTRRLHMRRLRDGTWQPCAEDHPKAVFGTGVWRIR